MIMDKYLYRRLKEYGSSDYYPFHMPAHKRNTELFNIENAVKIDITEIDGFDDLNHAEGILKELQDEMASLFRSSNAYILVNGSTAGILAAIGACTNHGDSILIARNCHKAVYHAVYLNRLNPIYVYPQFNSEFMLSEGIYPQNVEELLITFKNIKAIVITSPTYEGVSSDIREISKIAHRFQVPLIVDEAHGAHMGFHQYFPENAIDCGADIIIHSLHKTLPSLTQTALLHVNGSLVDRHRISRYLTYYQSSSPSYVLMAGVSQCMELLKNRGDELFSLYVEKLKDLRSELSQLKWLQLLAHDKLDSKHSFDYDKSKLVICSKTQGSFIYKKLLHEYHLQMEMATSDYVLGMTSICDRETGFCRLKEALRTIDVLVKEKLGAYDRDSDDFKLEPAHVAFNPYEAMHRKTQSIPMMSSEGRISAEYAYLYPPGVPFLVPGEEINHQVLKLIAGYMNLGLEIRGLSDSTLKTIKVTSL